MRINKNKLSLKNKLRLKNKLSLFVSFLFLMGFLWVAHGVHSNEPWIMELDYYGNEIFRLDISREATAIIFWFTQIGNITNLLYVALLLGALLLYNKEKHSFLWFGISMGITGGLTPLVLKQAFGRARPNDGMMTRVGYSFPSGHTMGTLALYGLVIILAAIYIKKAWLRYTVMISSLAIILMIAWSRIHLGVHYLSDILGSLFLGLSFLIVARLILSHFNGESEGY